MSSITVTVTNKTPPAPQPGKTRASACASGTFSLLNGTKFHTLRTNVAATFGYNETEIRFTKVGLPLAAQPNGYDKPNKKLKNGWKFCFSVSPQAAARAKVLGEQMVHQGQTFPHVELNDFELEVDSCRDTAAAAAAAAQAAQLQLANLRERLKWHTPDCSHNCCGNRFRKVDAYGVSSASIFTCGDNMTYWRGQPTGNIVQHCCQCRK